VVIGGGAVTGATVGATVGARLVRGTGVGVGVTSGLRAGVGFEAGGTLGVCDCIGLCVAESVGITPGDVGACALQDARINAMPTRPASVDRIPGLPETPIRVSAADGSDVATWPQSSTDLVNAGPTVYLVPRSRQ
jgi:hypothetical protein